MSARRYATAPVTIDFNTKDGRRFSVVHGYLLPALERENLTLLTGARVEALSFEGHRCTEVRLQHGAERHAIMVEAGNDFVCRRGRVSPPAHAFRGRQCRAASPLRHRRRE